MIKFKRAKGPFSDETSFYYVILDRTYTLREFLDYIIKERSAEWGSCMIIKSNDVCKPYTEDKIPFTCLNTHDCEYRRGKFISQPPSNLLDKKIWTVKANGGWSNMDYVIGIEENNDE